MINPLGRLKNLVLPGSREKTSPKTVTTGGLKPRADGFEISDKKSLAQNQPDRAKLRLLTKQKGKSSGQASQFSSSSERGTVTSTGSPAGQKSRKAVAMAMIGLSVAGAIGGVMVPMPSYAGEQVQQVSYQDQQQVQNRGYETGAGEKMTWTDQEAPSGQMAQQAASMGVSSEMVKHFGNIKQGPQRIKSLLQDVSSNYQSANQRQKDFLYKGFNGKTSVLFVTVSHRDAFIKGEAMGKNIFPMIQEKIDKGINDGKLTLNDANNLKKQVQWASKLTPQERQVVAEAFTSLYKRRPVPHICIKPITAEPAGLFFISARVSPPG